MELTNSEIHLNLAPAGGGCLHVANGGSNANAVRLHGDNVLAIAAHVR
jgi:hypothetical protein